MFHKDDDEVSRFYRDSELLPTYLSKNRVHGFYRLPVFFRLISFFWSSYYGVLFGISLTGFSFESTPRIFFFVASKRNSQRITSKLFSGWSSFISMRSWRIQCKSLHIMSWKSFSENWKIPSFGHLEWSSLHSVLFLRCLKSTTRFPQIKR